MCLKRTLEALINHLTERKRGIEREREKKRFCSTVIHGFDIKLIQIKRRTDREIDIERNIVELGDELLYRGAGYQRSHMQN